ncbi:hypothetical protein MP228_012939 [Amoeboaphelidium protococcarum]|nr:hypothetical protein MP228_012939 [Amoeboaphelidium protococcarum]
MQFVVHFRKQKIVVDEVSSDATLFQLKQTLEGKTGVEVEQQKLLGTGLSLTIDDSRQLGEIFSNSSKEVVINLTLIGTERKNINDMNRIVDRHVKRYAGQAKATREQVSTNQRNAQTAVYKYFQSFKVLDDTQEIQTKALQMLHRLSVDVGIVSLMQENRWIIGELIEISPVLHPTILGYNRNGGQTIALRLRTDDLSGFRHYNDVRSVLVHELTHQVHSEHNADFWHLCRKMERHVMDQTTTIGKPTTRERDHGIVTDWDRIESGQTFTTGAYRLGGGGTVNAEDSPDRDVIAQATMLRLTKQEQIIQEGCQSPETSDKNPNIG